MSDSFDQSIRIGLADLASTVTTDAQARVLAVGYIPQVSRRRLSTVLQAGCAALTVGVAATAVVLLISAGAASLPPLTAASYSLVGWTSTPTPARTSLLREAARSCDRTIVQFAVDDAAVQAMRQGSRFTFKVAPSMVASVKNVLAEARGKYFAVVSIYRDAPYVCIGGAAFTQARVLTSDNTIPVPARAGQLSAAHIVNAEGYYYSGGAQVVIGGGGRHAYGRVGAGVSAVLFAFANGRTVSATVQHGWYFAWWPWRSNPTSIQVTNTKGTFRSSATCTPGSDGCVLSSTQTNP